MMFPSVGTGLFLLVFFRGIGGLALGIGVILFLGWAIRHLPAAKLKQMTWWFLGVGIALLLLTSLFLPGINGLRYGMMGNRDFFQNQFPD